MKRFKYMISQGGSSLTAYFQQEQVDAVNLCLSRLHPFTVSYAVNGESRVLLVVPDAGGVLFRASEIGKTIQTPRGPIPAEKLVIAAVDPLRGNVVDLDPEQAQG